MEQNFFESSANSESHGDFTTKQKRCSITAPRTDPEKDGSSFECNICLDSAEDPVVTVCGHLYCWPCIYKWLHVQSSLSEDQQEQKCPVCKTDISPSLLVPLYGRGTSSEFESKKLHLGLHVPPRPQPSGLIASISHPSQQLHENFYHSQSQSQSFLHQQYFPHTYGGHAAMASSNPGSTPMTNLFNPTIAMFGELVYAGFFRSSGASLFAYPHQNSYPSLGNNNLRTRRHEMQLDKSLGRVCIFLFCCIILCLLLF